jgi:alpha-beta hydrolase superfamily lysophospholipase
MTAPMFELKKALIEDKPYNYDLTFERNLRTGSWMRFHKERELVMDTEQAARRIAHRRISVALGGPTPQWLAETRSFLKDLEMTELWRSPTLMLQAENDAFVGAGGQKRLCDRLVETGCRLVEVSDAFHDLLQERDSIRTPVLSEIEAFFRSHSSLLAEKTVHRLDS